MEVVMDTTIRLAATLLLTLTAATPSSPRHVGGPAYKSVLIKDVPHVKQKPDFCGEACVEMYLAKLGHKMTQDDVFNAAQLDPIHARGCYTKELAAALRALGFKTGNVWQKITAGAKGEIRSEWKSLHTDLMAG